jgi:DNA-binding MarR family transcriptional regulator
MYEKNGEDSMLDLKNFVDLHRKIECLHRQCIAEYWEDNQEDDILRELSLRQLNYLFTIERYGPCSLQTVMHYTGMSSSAVSAAVDKLVKVGVVDRSQNQENRREAIVSLNRNIRGHLKRINDRFCKDIAEAFSDCSRKEKDIINKFTEIMSGRLQ